MGLFSKISNLFSKPATRCQDVDRFLAEYLENKLDPSTQELFENHLEKCGACTTFLTQYESTVSLAKDSDSIPIPPELIEKTIEFLHSQIEFKS